MTQPSTLEEVLRVLSEAGLESVEAGEFQGAFVRQGRYSTLVFLVEDLEGNAVGREELLGRVDRGRAWCRERAQARWFSREAGLNLVFLHRGQIDRASLRGLPDKTGTHAAIVQSVTAVDVQKREVVQAKTWIVLGRVRSVLRGLARLS